MKKWFHSLSNSLFRSLSLLWIWIIFLQWISYMEPIWYQETNSMVLISITLIAIMEMILPFKYGYRILIEALMVLYIIHKQLVNYWIYMPSGTTFERMVQFASNMTPYLWFVIAAWALFALTAKWINNQRRILLFIGANLIAFAVLDSFTMSVLWPEVAG
ncbi:hypothetical protein [Paenibacillus pini]|uniref:Uncharacterized protein n=1 Tax=Paenibacillus pini JCM 16418 TaxID=1236976 RepID=W7YHA5_9BACL|nr:hypothetical protein [Paenibacillus pini]GAF06968.1 hypothetical protein JCM16418_954 [Paenibacillus pini JCM 16418]